jgi:hypothetical protein
MTATTAGDVVVLAAILGALFIASACWSERRYRRLLPRRGLVRRKRRVPGLPVDGLPLSARERERYRDVIRAWRMPSVREPERGRKR